MSCDTPLEAFWSKEYGKNGGRKITFKEKESDGGRSLKLPCGRCMGCRLEHSRQWAVRLVHEYNTWEKKGKDSSFITLTYSPENLPEGGTLVKKHFQDFMKRLRDRIGVKISFFHCGEYGEKKGRPHYHAIIFGYDFPDKKEHSKNKFGQAYYVSKELQQLWPYGFSIIGNVTFESCAYVSRYVTKKVTGDKEFQHYANPIIDSSTGEVIQLPRKIQEYATMSRRPAIGKDYIDAFGDGVIDTDSVVMLRTGVDGKSKTVEMKPPRYYLKKLEEINPMAIEELKQKRIIDREQKIDAYKEYVQAIEDREDLLNLEEANTWKYKNDDERKLEAKKIIRKQAMRICTREYEDGTNDYITS